MDKQVKLSEVYWTQEICYGNLSPFETKVIMFEAFECIKIASRFGGKVFGGFVRNIVVPYTRHVEREVSLKDVDIWFKTKEQADKFRKAIGKNLIDISEGVIKPSMGAFCRYLCTLEKYGVQLITVDIIVAKELPVNDFDVNTVTYSLSEDDEWITDAPKFLLEKIERKEATMLSSYIEKINEANNERDPLGYKKRIERIFLDKGWKVYVNQQILIAYNENEHKLGLEPVKQDKFTNNFRIAPEVYNKFPLMYNYTLQ